MDADNGGKAGVWFKTERQRPFGIKILRPSSHNPGNGLIRFIADKRDCLRTGDITQGLYLLGHADTKTGQGDCPPRVQFGGIQRRCMHQKIDGGAR